MSLTRRRFLTTGVASSASLALGSSLSLLPGYAYSSTTRTLTLSFCGTATTRDEGEVTRAESHKGIYLPEAGYIPVRINQELGGNTRPESSSAIGQTIRGAGENDWAEPRNSSEELLITGPLTIPDSLKNVGLSFSGGDRFSRLEQLQGRSMAALALHGANLAIASGAECINLIGHSRGACETIMMAWFIYAYGNEEQKLIPINIFAIDPVPGVGNWYSILTQLPPNVNEYVAVHSWDHLDTGFQALAPRPNGRMRGQSNDVTVHQPTFWDRVFRAEWRNIANGIQQQDPLAAPNVSNDDVTRQPVGYELYACRGKHATVAGNTTADGAYDPTNLSASVAPVPSLIYKMARGYLTKWGTTFVTPCAISEGVHELRMKIHQDHRDFDQMGGGEIRNSSLPNRPFVRRISSFDGRRPNATYFMDDVVGDPPYKLSYLVTKDRKDAGWVNWKFL